MGHESERVIKVIVLSVTIGIKVIVSNLLDSKSCFLPPFCEEGGRVKKNETPPFIKFPKIETLVVTGDI